MSPENDRIDEDEMRSEYDLQGGVRGKYYKQYRERTNVVLLDTAVRPAFSKGDKVVVKALGNKVGMIDGSSRQEQGRTFYPVSFNPVEPSFWYPEEALSPFSATKTVAELLVEKQFADPQAFIKSLIYKKLERPLSDNLYTFYASRTEFQVHQFKPVMKFLGSNDQKLLLADEVGLGKTIEAGIILTEQQARLDISRILIVCPAVLTYKWQREMQRRFSQNFEILKKKDFEGFLEAYSEYGESQKLKAICSLQTLRASTVIDRLGEVEPHFDLVIVDEAHHLRNPETASSELGTLLSELSDAMLFLSATPLQLGTPDLFNLLNILLPRDFPEFELLHSLLEPNEFINNAGRLLRDPAQALAELRKVEHVAQADRFRRNPYYKELVRILSEGPKLSKQRAIEAQRLLSEISPISYVFTRTKKRDVLEAHFPVREARVIKVKFTAPEMDFYNAVTEFVAKQTVASSRQGISFALIMPQRQVSSCIQATKSALEKLINKRKFVPPTADDGDVVDASADIEEPILAGEGVIKAAKALVIAANQIGDVDTKFDMFREALKALDQEDPHAKIIVFSFFKRTLEYLRGKLERSGYAGSVGVIHGDIKSVERQKVLRAFREGSQIKILLSSEVGGEGLDFEFCNVLFNYDLPWNPMRVEQRIGRLDRYGQLHDKILIYNFSMLGTIDDEILSRLYGRIKIFERYIGDLDVILGDEITRLTKEIFSTSLTKEQRVRVIEKVAENIARKHAELERFERENQRFIGQDAFFTQEISKIQNTKRFITAEEVEHLLRAFLAAEFPKGTLLPPSGGRPKVFVLKADEPFRRFVWRNSEGDDNRKRVDKRLSQQEGCLVTFDSGAACLDESLEFVTLHHPIIRAIKRFYDERKGDLTFTSQLILKGDPKYVGEYFFFIYLLEKTALKTELQMVPVLVDRRNYGVKFLEDLTDWFLAELVKASRAETRLFDYTAAELDKASGAAGDYLALLREEEEGKLKRANDALVDNRAESLKQSTKIKISHANSTIAKLLQRGHAEDSAIVRLHKGRIRKMEDSLAETLDRLEQRRAVSVAHNLAAGGILRVDPN